MLNFVLCDDNLKILDKLETMLENIFIKNNYEACVAFKSHKVDEILNYVDNYQTDVLLLDINLRANQTGLQLAEAVRKKNKNAYIIFTTGHLEYAMVAYKFKTFDYIAKPITMERLEDTVKRLFEDIQSQPKKYIKIDTKNTVIDEAEVQYVKRDGMKLVFHTAGRDYDTYSSFNKIKPKLPETYVRCHKSYIVNLAQIKNVEPVTNTITFSNGDTCDIGPKYKNEFMGVLKEYGNFE